MKLKTLIIVVAVLTVASVVASIFDRGGKAPEGDPRVGSPLVERTAIEQTGGIFIRANGSEVTLEQSGAGSANWVVRDYHDLPLDFSKLATLVRNLSEAEILRFASANPERMATMDFGDSVLELRSAGGEPLVSIELGRNLSSGGRFVRFGEDGKSYVASLSAPLDTTPKNWADAGLVPVEAGDVTRFEIGFETDEPLVVERESDSGSWNAEELPEGASLDANAVDSLLRRITGLRFTEVTDPDAPEVQSAREHARTFVLGLGNGTSYAVAIGRQPAPPPPPPSDDGDEEADEVDEPKPGPVFVSVQSSDADSGFNERMQRLGYQVSEWTYTGMPGSLSAFVTTTPVEPPPPEAPAEPSPVESEEPSVEQEQPTDSGDSDGETPEAAGDGGDAPPSDDTE